MPSLAVPPNLRGHEELYDLDDDLYELNNLAGVNQYARAQEKYAGILDSWIEETGDKGQSPENIEGLKLMLGIWGAHATNPEYEPLRQRFDGLAGSQFGLKSKRWRPVNE